MKRFIGTKTVFARAMTRGEYNEYRGWAPPDKEDQSAEGYLVEYADGGGANDVRHANYISWSPKEQFENGYQQRPAVDGLAPHQQRVVDEKANLGENIHKLVEFFDNPIFASLAADEQLRLKQQAVAMDQYFTILLARIDAFTTA